MTSGIGRVVGGGFLAMVTLAAIACGQDPREPAEESKLVVGTRVNHHLTPAGEALVPVSMQDRPLTAWTLNGTTFTSVPVAETGDGGFTIDVPAGTTYYVMDGRAVVVTSARSLDLGRWIQGRPDVEPPAQMVESVTVNATGLVPWADGDSFQLSSESTFVIGGASPTSPPAAGTTSLSNATCAYETWFNGSLDATKGDVAQLHQVRTRELIPDAGIYESYIVASGSAGAVTLDGITQTTLNVQFTPVEQKTVTVDVRGSEFDALLAEVNPAAYVSGGSTIIVGVPQGLTRGYVGYLSELVRTDYRRWTTDDVMTVHYGNPSSSWGEVMETMWVYVAPAQLPDASRGYVVATASRLGPVTQMSGTPQRPNLSPPRNLQVDGKDGWSSGTLSSLTPALSWSAPSKGSPTGYAVRIRELYVNTTGQTRSISRGAVLTPSTSVVLPPGLLESGKSYVFVVQANQRSGGLYDAARAPFYDWLSDENAEVASAQFLAP